MTVRAIAKTCEAYKVNKFVKPTFKPHEALVYDQRLLSWKGLDRVSLLTLRGRNVVPIVFGEYQEVRFKRICGQADLITRDGTFFLAVVVDMPAPPRHTQKVSWRRPWHQKHRVRRRRRRVFRRPCQWLAASAHKYSPAPSKEGHKVAKRLLKKRRHKEARFATDVNHRIAKKLVAKAKDTGRGIALEDLSGIRDRITVSKAQRRAQHSWVFHQLRCFIEYKARLPLCRVWDRWPADTIAAINIGRRVEVMQPYAVVSMLPLQAHGFSRVVHDCLADS